MDVLVFAEVILPSFRKPSSKENLSIPAQAEGSNFGVDVLPQRASRPQLSLIFRGSFRCSHCVRHAMSQRLKTSRKLL